MGDDGAACVRIHPRNVDVDEFDPEIVRAVADGAPASKVKRLLQGGADVNAVTSHGWSSLYLAVLNNDVDNVKLLLKWGASVTYVDDDGDDLLLCAICNERPEPEVVVELLCAGMLVDERTRARALVELKQPGQVQGGAPRNFRPVQLVALRPRALARVCSLETGEVVR